MYKFNDILPLKTERLSLCPLNIIFLETAHNYAGDVENTRYMIYLPNDTIQETEYFLISADKEWEKEYPHFYEFAIILDNNHIGAVSVSLSDNGEEGEFGWIIHKNYHGHGYATEAAKAVLDFAVKYLKIKKAIAHCDYRNEQSEAVMRKIGFTLERNDGIRYYTKINEEARELMYSKIINEN